MTYYQYSKIDHQVKMFVEYLFLQIRFSIYCLIHYLSISWKHFMGHAISLWFPTSFYMRIIFNSHSPRLVFTLKIVDILMMSFVDHHQLKLHFTVTRNTLITVSIRGNLRSFIFVRQIIYNRHFCGFENWKNLTNLCFTK